MKNEYKKLGIISPSNNVNKLFPNRYKQGIKNLSEIGFAAYSYDELFPYNTYKKNSVSNRIDEINYFLNENINFLIASIGGYISIQLLDKIDYDLIKKNKTVICGFSDITALLLAIYSKTHIIQLYGPTFIVNLCEYDGIDEYTKKYFLKAINHEKYSCIASSYSINEFIDWNILEKKKLIKKKEKKGNDWKSIRKEVAYGKLIGGNLSTILLIIGTQYLPIDEFDNSILFLEDCETNINEFCSYLESLRIKGVFEKIKGLVIGKFDSQEMNNDIEDFLNEYFKEDNFPILFNVDFGHTYPILTIPIGAYAKLDNINKKIEIINYDGKENE